IRKVTGASISTIAGNGQPGPPALGAVATQTGMTSPSVIALDAADNIYFLVSNTGAVRRISSGIISLVAGNGPAGYSGDGGPASFAAVNANGLAFDARGNLYISDVSADRV